MPMKQEEEPGWKKEVEKVTDKAKEEAKEVGKKIINKSKDILRGFIDRLP